MAEVSFLAWCKKVVCAYERAHESFMMSLGEVPFARLVEPFRELVKLYRVVVDMHGIRDYAVACGYVPGSMIYQRELFVRGTPVGVLYSADRLAKGN